MRSVLFAFAFASTALCVAACGDGNDNGEESYSTLQECFDDHHNVESLPADQAITICCLEHPIGGQAAGVVCGADSASCTTYVTGHLTGATADEIMAGCTDYQTQKGQ